MSIKTLPVTIENLRNFVDRKIQELDPEDPNYRKSDVSSLQCEYQSLLRKFEDKKLTESELEKHINFEINSLIEEQKAEMHQKKLGKGPRQLYFHLRNVYYNVLYEFGLKRVRNY